MTENAKKVHYQDIVNTLQTGDLLLCHGLEVQSLRIQALEGSMWSHVGMIVKLPEFDEPLLWQSYPLDTIPDVELHKIKAGPMLVPLHTQLVSAVEEMHDSMFAIRHLNNVERTPEMMKAFLDFVNEAHKATFPTEMQMYLEALEGKLGIRAPYSNYFCSELVAETYMRLGLLPARPVANSYEPKDFSDQGHLPLQKGATLGEMMLLMMDVDHTLV
ncbi:MAG TPA: hypothetical protein VFV52_16145 [Bacilli bacterium]|nr:hypothetical protein [Bacilli bacterium]